MIFVNVKLCLMKIVVGRNPSSDYVVFDPQKRVSRIHAELEFKDGKYFITDVGSSNGTYINGKKIEPRKKFLLPADAKVTLSTDYVLDYVMAFKQMQKDDDSTKLFEKNIKFDNEKTIFSDGNKTVVFDTKKTSFGDLMQMDKNPYLSIGRTPENNIVFDNTSISRKHCQIKLMAPMIIEVVDLNSTNGTFADDVRLEPDKKYQFSSSVILRLGNSTFVDLKKIFKEKIEIIKKPQAQPSPSQSKPKDFSATKEEIDEFNKLEKLWSEYQERMHEANGAMGNYSIGGAVISGAAHFLGPVGIVVGIGASIFARYLGMQKSNNIRNDVNYEEAFLVAYSCPRCEESFQKKPWVTIRDCSKCKTKFR